MLTDEEKGEGRSDWGTNFVPCPFCGQHDTVRLHGFSVSQQSGVRYVRCDEAVGGCGALGPKRKWKGQHTLRKAIDKATTAWNHRPRPKSDSSSPAADTKTTQPSKPSDDDSKRSTPT